MKYTGVECVACKQIFDENSDAVVCPVCGAPHHRECWMQTGKCAMNDLHAQGYAWVFPQEILEARKKEETAAKPPEKEKLDIKLKNGENIIACPNCGAANYENDIYCLRCGSKLNGEAPPEDDGEEDRGFFASAFREGDRSDGYYRSLRDDFDRYGGISPDALIDGIPCSEYSAFVGGQRPGKIIRRISTLERYDRKISWTWAAVIFGPVWFLWRKMKKEGLILCVALLFLAAMYATLEINPTVVSYYKEMIGIASNAARGELSISEVQQELSELQGEYMDKIADSYSTGRLVALDVIQYFAIAGIPVISGAFAMHRYRKKVKEEIMEIRSQCSSMDEYARALESRGGTSSAGAVVGIIAVVLAVMCVMYLPFAISMLV